MFDKNIIKLDFGKAAVNYDRKAILQEQIRKQAAVLAKLYFPKQALVLDIGCGTASFAQEKKSLGVKWDIVGVDISYGMCTIAKTRNSNIVNADALFLPVADASVDAVFSSLFLQWSEQPEAVIKEILRVLKPQGTAVITTFVRGTLSELEQAFLVVDSAPHISKFIEPSQLLLRIAHIGGLVIEVDEQEYIEYYDDVMSLMRSIKDIGAGNKVSGRRKGLMTPSQLKKLEASYKAEDEKYPATWNVLTMVIGKADE